MDKRKIFQVLPSSSEAPWEHLMVAMGAISSDEPPGRGPGRPAQPFPTRAARMWLGPLCASPLWGASPHLTDSGYFEPMGQGGSWAQATALRHPSAEASSHNGPQHCGERAASDARPSPRCLRLPPSRPFGSGWERTYFSCGSQQLSWGSGWEPCGKNSNTNTLCLSAALLP